MQNLVKRARSGVQHGFQSPKTLWIFCGVSLAYVFFLMLTRLPLKNEGDTGFLIESAKMMIGCVAEGQWTGCRAGGFPLLQHIPVFFLQALGFEHGNELDLARISIFTFFSILTLSCTFLYKHRGPTQACISLMVMLTGPFMIYYRTSFGEPLAAFISLLFVLACIKGARGWITAVLVVLTGMSKDTALPFMLVIAVGCYYPLWVKGGFERIRGPVTGLLVGACLSGLQVLLFNYFRFGTWYNTWYGVPTSFVQTLKDQVSFFAGLWLAPNSGLVFFWFTFVVLILSVSGSFLMRIGNKPSLWIRHLIRGNPEHTGAFLALTLCLGGMTLGLSGWWSPFGWVAWGPRLMLPWMPGLIVMCLYYFHDAPSMVYQKMRKHKVLSAVLLTIGLALSVPQFLGNTDLNRYNAMMVAPVPPHCPVDKIIDDDVSYYYSCMWYKFWLPTKLVLFEVWKDIPGTFLKRQMTLGYLLMLILWTLQIHRLLKRESKTLKS